MNDELEMIWKEAVVACLKLLSRHSPEQSKETHENPPSEWSVFRPKFEPCTSGILPPDIVWSVSD
jgi:hypothetical protein